MSGVAARSGSVASKFFTVSLVYGCNMTVAVEALRFLSLLCNRNVLFEASVESAYDKLIRDLIKLLLVDHLTSIAFLLIGVWSLLSPATL